MREKSEVWRFFDRVINNDRCHSVICKLCDSEYKFFGNTTNLRVHLKNRHPIQWDLRKGTLDDNAMRNLEGENDALRPKRRKRNVRYFVSVENGDSHGDQNADAMPKIEIRRAKETQDNSDTDAEIVEDEEAAAHLVQSYETADNVEWLEEDTFQTVETYEPKRKRMKAIIKREVESPPPKLQRRSSSYLTQTPKYDRQEPIFIGSTPNRDEHTVFGEYVANKLRKNKNPQARNNLQQLIVTLLWQSEFGMYDNPDTVKRILMSSIQQETELCEVQESQETTNDAVQNQSTESEIPN